MTNCRFPHIITSSKDDFNGVYEKAYLSSFIQLKRWFLLICCIIVVVGMFKMWWWRCECCGDLWSCTLVSCFLLLKCSWVRVLAAIVWKMTRSCCIIDIPKRDLQDTRLEEPLEWCRKRYLSIFGQHRNILPVVVCSVTHVMFHNALCQSKHLPLWHINYNFLYAAYPKPWIRNGQEWVIFTQQTPSSV